MIFRDMVPRTSLAACTMACTMLLCTAIAPASAQERAGSVPATLREEGWMIHAELGASTRTTWSAAANAPTVSTAPGPMVSLGIRRWFGVANIGASARLAESAVDLDELGSRWSGGTVRDLQLVGTVGVPVLRGRFVRADIEAGGGFTFISAPDNVEPFMSSPSALATTDAALLLRLPENRRSSNTTVAFVQRSMSLLVRYNLMRVSPSLDTRSVTASSESDATDGWVGRFVVGVRITR